jgi:glycosyltransferase involved in cell wall biosynthesis
MSRQPTILNVAEFSFHDHPGGVPRLATELAEQQARWGYRVFYISGRVKEQAPDREDLNGVTYLRVREKHYPPPDSRNVIDRIFGVRRAAQAVQAEVGRVDLVQAHLPLQGIGAASGCSPSSPFVVNSIHSPWLMEVEAQRMWEGSGGLYSRLRSRLARSTAGLLERDCYRRARVLSCDSRYTFDRIQEFYPRLVRRRRMEVLPGWVNCQRFTPEGPRTDWTAQLGRAPQGPVLFTLRSFKPRYGLQTFIEAAALLRDQGRDFELVLGGDGPLRDRLRAMVAERDLEGRVTMLGKVSDELLPILYRSCDVFVVPTQALECFGIIILEAFASGKPVIATPVGAIPELMTLYPEGLLARATAPDLAACLARHLDLLEKHPFPPEKQRALREGVLAQYSLEVSTDRFRAVYEAGR